MKSGVCSITLTVNDVAISKQFYENLRCFVFTGNQAKTFL